ncbi:MAG: zf-TFIIB domain-containing protein, partial [Acidobacteria bacterium]|nr:zf-TFIIB domain-containing protein [Acidobacteriota bacterium]
DGSGPQRSEALAAGGPIQYRPCPVCGKLMNRQNYGRRSGIIVDRCGEHGIWFDHEELDRILAWIRRGGLRQAQARQVEEQAEKTREQRLSRSLPPVEPIGAGRASVGGWLSDLLTSFDFFDLF